MNTSTETQYSSPEQFNLDTPEQLFAEISKREPKPIELFVPSNGEEQQQLFMSGEIRNPHHTYEKLMALDTNTAQREILGIGERLDGLFANDPVSKQAYGDFIQRYANLYELIGAAQDVHSSDETVAAAARLRFMELNEGLFGAPDESTYRSLLKDKAESVQAKELPAAYAAIRDELNALLPETSETIERFRPSAETIESMNDIAEFLYGGMFAHIPEGVEEFSPEAIASVFREIIESEFGEAAEGWRVDVVKAAAINVVASEKLIKIPENRKQVSPAELRGLIAHEIGVHMMRSVTGAETTLPILAVGLSDYYDAEEGLGKVMEQASKGEYEEAGVPYYLIAGLAHFEGKDFRAIHDIIWRMNVFEKVDPAVELDDNEITKHKVAAYKSVMRIMRGTDSLPWFKDLAYFNGTAKMWKYAEQAAGDPEKFQLLLIGKADITNDIHRRILNDVGSR